MLFEHADRVGGLKREPREIRGFGGESEVKMSFIETIGDESARDDTATLYEEDRSSLGYVANCKRVFSHRPDVMRGWEHLNGAIKFNRICGTTSWQPWRRLRR